MDTKQIIEMHLNALEGEKQGCRKSYLAELERLGDEAKSAAQHAAGPLPTPAFLETHMARLRELRETYEKAECAREILRRVSEAASFEARTAGK
jgi:hypothetical protein